MIVITASAITIPCNGITTESGIHPGHVVCLISNPVIPLNERIVVVANAGRKRRSVCSVIPVRRLKTLSWLVETCLPILSSYKRIALAGRRTILMERRKALPASAVRT